MNKCSIVKGCRASKLRQLQIWLRWHIGLRLPINWVPNSWLADWGCVAYAGEFGGCNECNPGEVKP